MPTGNEKLNLLVMADSYVPHAGGSRVYYHNLYRHLVAQFPDSVTVLTRKVPGWEDFDRAERHERLTVVRRQTPLPNWKMQEWPKCVFPMFDAWRTVSSQTVDLVHVGDLFPPGVVGLALKKLCGTPYLVYCHGEEITQTDRFRHQPKVRNRIYQEAAIIIAASEFARSNLLRIGVPAAKIHKITPGVDCERFAPAPSDPDLMEQLGLHGKKILLTVARLWRRKGHDMVLQALAKLPERRTVKYLIAGEGPEKARLQQMAQDLGLNESVTFLGYVRNDKLPKLYNLCDVMVMPNREESNGDIEGFGMTFLEAGAAGKPVIGGLSGGAQESVQDGKTGILVDPLNTGQLTDAISLLLGDATKCHEMGDAGLARARQSGWPVRARMLREICVALKDEKKAPAVPLATPAFADDQLTRREGQANARLQAELLGVPESGAERSVHS